MEKNKVRRIERIFKGVSNHWRVEILLLIKNNPGITLETITDKLHCNIKTISEHTRRLKTAGLIIKKYKGRFVEHYLTPYGINMCKIIMTFQ